MFAINRLRFLRWFKLDHKYHDIPVEEENDAPSTRIVKQDITLDSWTDQECYDFTSFKKDQLREIYDHFGLAELAAQTNGFIHVPTSASHYTFHPEQLFLFTMTKCRTGFGNKQLCDLIFGGHASRWSFGYPWMLEYLDERYERTISHQKLLDFVQEFPRFYNAMSSFVQKESVRHFTDGTTEERPGLNFLPFKIFGFIDCSIDRISKPFSGPDGDYIGAPRRGEYDAAQNAVYTAYKKCHAIKVETVMLPNGISTIYGPMSGRVHDVGGILQMSGLDDFLFQIQQGNEQIFSAFGDNVYNAQHLHCIRSYFKSLIPGMQITDAQKICNNRMKSIRQTIEFSYGDIETIFKICSNPTSYQLGKKLPYAQEQLRVCHLFANIYTCLNGNKASSHAKFDCPPPLLRDYLRLP